MALRGNLKDFSLPDVFQLVQLSGKTGVLRITGPDAEGSIWFRDGDVFFAQSNWRRDQLGERLVSAQKITPAALSRALEMRHAEAEGGRRLGQILVAEGYITQQVLEAFVQEQIQDTIFDIMRWDEGDFDFEVLPETVHEDIGLAVSVENIVMEGSRRLEEWNRIKKKVPSTEMVFKMATAPGEGTFEISLKPIEWNLLLLVDGTRTVRDLAVETRRTDFEVARVIYGLFSAGLLEVAAAEEVEKLKGERSQREGKRAKHEAARRARDEAQQAEALELESKLAAEAESRRVASAPAAAATAAREAPSVSADSAAPASASAAPPEEPEFLSAGAAAASADDMAVFEQMMEAVLAPQAPGVSAPATAFDEETPAALTPSFAPEVITESDVEREASFEPALEVGPGIVPEPEIAIESTIDSVLGVESAPEFELAIEPELASGSEPMPVPGFEPEPSFGVEAADAEELSDLLLVEDSHVAETAPGSIDATYEFGPEIGAIPPAPVAEPASIAAPEGFVPTGDFETDLRTLGLGEYPEELLEPEYTPGTEYSAELAVESVTAEPSDFIIEQGSVDGDTDDLIIDGGEEDLDALLASLEHASPASSGRIASDTDFGIEEPVAEGVISTDAFLAEFDSDVSLGGGLGDELTALTGGGTARNRPVATVSKLPEAGESHMLQRDELVDRTLLLKIIDGIEKL